MPRTPVARVTRPLPICRRAPGKLLRSLCVALAQSQHSEIAQRCAYPLMIVQLSPCRQALIVQGSGCRKIALSDRQQSRRVQRTRHQPRAPSTGQKAQESLPPIAGFVDGAEAIPIAGQCDAQLESPLDLAVFSAPEQRRTQVVLFKVQPICPADTLRPRNKFEYCPLAELDEVVDVSSSNLVGFPTSD